VIRDKEIFGLDLAGKLVKIKSILPDSNLDDILEDMSLQPMVPVNIPFTELP